MVTTNVRDCRVSHTGTEGECRGPPSLRPEHPSVAHREGPSFLTMGLVSHLHLIPLLPQGQSQADLELAVELGGPCTADAPP